MTLPSGKPVAQVMLRGTFWSYAISYGGRFVSLLSTIVLARLLTQDDFGVAGYALLFTSFVDVLSGLGITQALIYHKEEEGIADTAFWSGMLIGIALCAITWLTAPLAGLYFKDARAVPVIQVLGLTYPIAALANVHGALLRKNLSFGKQFLPEFVNFSAKAVLAIGLALLGFGPWSLIIGQVGGKVFSVAAYWRVLPWRPSFTFARKQFQSLFGYGTHSALVDILSVIQSNVDYLLVSRLLGAAALGVYTLAFRIPEIVIIQFCSAVTNVIFPVFSMWKEDAETLRNGFLQATQYILIIVVPVASGLALISRPLVLILFSEKWAQAIPVMQAISIYMLALALPYNAGVVYKAKGQQMILVKLTIAEIVVLAPALYWVIQTYQSIAAVGWAQAFFALLFGLAQVILAMRILSVSTKDILAAILPALVSGLVMVLSVWTVITLTQTYGLWAELLSALATGCLSYGLMLYLVKRDAVLKIAQTLRTVTNGNL